jgi:hypothetical protein
MELYFHPPIKIELLIVNHIFSTIFFHDEFRAGAGGKFLMFESPCFGVTSGREQAQIS